ncbi:MAG: DNA primase, partial [Pseudohongiellaceae bacterium]
MSGLIPQSFIDDLLSRVDIVDVVEARVRLKKTGKNYSGLCPFHQEKTPSFSVEPDKQFYYCFGCGAGGNALGFIMNYENLEFPQAIEMLAGSMGMEVPREETTRARQKREQDQSLFDILQNAARYYQSQLRQHPQRGRAVEYLKSRGLSGEIARDFGLGYAPPGWDNLLNHMGNNARMQKLLLDSGMLIEKPDDPKKPVYDRFRDRIMYPIRDKRGRVIAFGGRVLGDDKPKYLNSPETAIFHKGEELYGLFEARRKVRKLERILIVEGYMDVIALAQNDIHYSVATLGTATSTSHLKRLFRLVPEVVFCFDGDAAGRDAAWRALQQALPLMEDGRTARFLFLPEGEDPDSQVRKIGTLAFVQGIAEAMQLAQFFFSALGDQVDMNSLEGRARLAKLALPHIRQLPQGVYRQLIFDQLAQTTGVDRQALLNMEPDATDKPHPNAPAPASAPAPPVPRKSRSHNPQISACMKAVNLLLLNPAMIAEMDFDEDLQAVDSPDLDLLLQVITLARRYPDSNTPKLLGRVYATPQGSHLVQLLNREQIT